MRKYLSLLLALFLIGAAPEAFAQTTLQAYSQSGHATLAVTASSARVALGSTEAAGNAQVAVLNNQGAADAYVMLGDSTIVSTTGGFLVPAGQWRAIYIGQQTYLAAITASATTTLDISTGRGTPIGSGGGGSGGGGGGSVTQGTSPWVVSLATGASTAANQTSVIGAGSGTAGGTAAASTMLPGAVFNTTQPTITNGQQIGLQVDNRGNLRVTLLSAGPAAPGTAATTANLEAGTYNSGGVTLTNGQQASVQLDAAGNLKSTLTSAGGVAPGTAGTSSNLAGSIYNSGGVTATTGQQMALQSDANGYLYTHQAAGQVSIIGTCNVTIPINQITSTDVYTTTAKGHICSIALVSATQQGVSISIGTGSICATNTVYLFGGSGGTMAFGANGGLTIANGIPWLQTTVIGQHICVLQSGVGNISGTITLVDN